MPVKIRLQRHGKKGKPFYWVVAADSRSKRDGKFLEKLGIYNPNTNPATVEINVDSAVKWLQNGAQPTDTARTLLSRKGALLKHHLVKGVAKGALTEEQVEERFAAWLAEKDAANTAEVSALNKEKEAAKAKALEAEKEANEKRAAEIAAANAPEPEVVEEAAEEASEEVAEAPVAEEAAEEVAEEVAEAPVAEEAATEEAPAEESSEEEKPAE
ncbi:MAG: 30S ribosomal protein S16 [Flavobacteriaceae bacterium]|jgi:small subunit ribosomal protein S16|nr:MAG: 30S ribosomal protein S16 [Flavobacteriaceae bacterium]